MSTISLILPEETLAAAIGFEAQIIAGKNIENSGPAEGGAVAGRTQPYTQGWDVVGGLSEVVQQLKEMVLLPLMYPEVFQAMHLTPPRYVRMPFIHSGN